MSRRRYHMVRALRHGVRATIPSKRVETIRPPETFKSPNNGPTEFAKSPPFHLIKSRIRDRLPGSICHAGGGENLFAQANLDAFCGQFGWKSGSRIPGRKPAYQGFSTTLCLAPPFSNVVSSLRIPGRSASARFNIDPIWASAYRQNAVSNCEAGTFERLESDLAKLRSVRPRRAGDRRAAARRSMISPGYFLRSG
jgi:hypothetical protein